MFEMKYFSFSKIINSRNLKSNYFFDIKYIFRNIYVIFVDDNENFYYINFFTN